MRPGEADAAVIQAHPDRALGIAVAVGGNPHWCGSDPELGARHAVAEAARNALTDCLNFGDPADPLVMGDFSATLEGLAVAAEALGGLAARGHPLPFVSGNVSLYNQTGSEAIPASPIVLCAGVVRNLHTLTPQSLAHANDFLIVVGEPRDELTGSAFVRHVLRERSGAPPSLDLPREARLQELAVLAAEGRWVHAAHDVSDGGLLVALAEMVMSTAPERGLGIELDVSVFEAPTPLVLWSERPAIVFAVPPQRAARLFQAARERSLLAWPAGTVIQSPGLRALIPGSEAVEWSADALRAASALPLARLWNEEIG